MSELDNIVDVQITTETTAITTASFNIPMILAEFTDWTDSRTRIYGSLPDVGSDFPTNSKVYAIATRLFGQDQKPAQIVVGRKSPSDADYLTAYQAVQSENNTWFGLVSDTHLPAQVLALAGRAEADSKLFGTSTQAGETLTVATTDIGSQLKALGYDQTYTIFSEQADTQYPEAAWMGSQLQYVPGNNTWKFKTLEGVTVSRSLTPTQIANLRAKNVNFYIPVAGVNITEEGVAASGEFIDTTVGILWTIARMKEAVFGMLVRKPKVPMSDQGFTMVEAQMRSVLALGVTNGLYLNYQITVPRLTDIPQNQRAQRIAGDFLFTAQLQSAIHAVRTIRGNVTI